MIRLLKATFEEFSIDDALAWSAALAFPLLILLVAIAGLVWGEDVRAQEPKGNSWIALAKKRALSFLAVLATGLLLAFSFRLSALLGTAGKFFAEWLPASSTILMGWNWLISLAIMTLFFGLVFRLLPDIQITWRDVWTGALVTSLLFQAGNIAISYYLSTSGTASMFGAASSVVALLIWINYSTGIFLFGAEFTEVYSRRERTKKQPSRGDILPAQG